MSLRSLAVALALAVCGVTQAAVVGAERPHDSQPAQTDALEHAAQHLAHHLRSSSASAALNRYLLGTNDAPTLTSALRLIAPGVERDDRFKSRVLIELSETRGAQQPPQYIAWTPAGQDTKLQSVPALHIASGQQVLLDASRAPEQPVYVLSIDEGASEFVRRANAALRNVSLNSMSDERLLTIQNAVEASVETTRLERISVQDDKEPWSSGRAEMYMLVSGVIGDNEPEIFLVDLPYLDYAGESYHPRQIIVDWRQFGFDAVNVLVYEHDDNTSYQSLVLALASVIGEIGSLAGLPEAIAIEQIASAIIAAMPEHWFANADDFVDAIYTVERGASEFGRQGAAGNVRIDHVPYLLNFN